MASWWQMFRNAFGSGGPAENVVRDALKARAERKENFTALDVVNDLTGDNPHRTVEDVKKVIATVERFVKERLLEPYGYTVDATGLFVPPRANPPVNTTVEQPGTRNVVLEKSPPPAVEPPKVVSQLGKPKPPPPDSPELAALIAQAVKAKQCALYEGKTRWLFTLASKSYALELTRPGQPPQRTTSSFASDAAASEGFSKAIRNAWARGLRATPATPPVAPNAPAAGKSSPPGPKPFQIDPQLLGLSKDELRQRALKIDPYLTAWIGRVDTIPPQSDERTALIDRGLVLRGLLDEAQLKEIHEVGDQWLVHRDAARIAQVAAAKTAQQALEQVKQERAAAKAKKQAEAAQKRRERAEAVAHRKATDLIYLGPGVSSGLGDRRSNLEKLRSVGLPVLSTPADVAELLGLTVPKLRWLCFHTEAAERPHYTTFEVPKRSGGVRRLTAPKKLLKQVQRVVLAQILEKVPISPQAHGFVRGRSTVTNAQAHLGQALVVTKDLKDFFPSIRFPKVRRLFESLGYSPAVSTVLALLCTESPREKVVYAGKTFWVATSPRALPQGAPTSPALANLAAGKLDKVLTDLLTARGWTYTRYADDLTFSGPGFDRKTMGFVQGAVRQVARLNGFEVNLAKGRVMGNSRRQQVTGLVVNEKLGTPRELVRRVRAILHQAGKTGLEAQNKEGRPGFEGWLRGTIAYIAMADPKKGAALLATLEALPTSDVRH